MNERTNLLMNEKMNLLMNEKMNLLMKAHCASWRIFWRPQISGYMLPLGCYHCVAVAWSLNGGSLCLFHLSSAISKHTVPFG